MDGIWFKKIYFLNYSKIYKINRNKIKNKIIEIIELPYLKRLAIAVGDKTI